MQKQRYDDKEIETMVQEMLPLIGEYKTHKKQNDIEYFKSKEYKKLKERCDTIMDYYVSRKKWKSIQEYDSAMNKIDVFAGLRGHRESLRIRVLYLRQRELFKTAA